MNEHTYTLPSGIHALGGAAGRVADVTNAVATSIPRQRSALRDRWAQLGAFRAERRRIARRRPDYIEHAAMAREMYRL